MKKEDLYLEIHDEKEEVIICPIETMVLVFVLKYVNTNEMRVTLVKTAPHEYVKGLKLNRQAIAYLVNSTISQTEVPNQVADCVLPTIKTSTEFFCIAGLCSVIRRIFKQATDIPTDVRKLMGFRGGCLMACAEVSVWTKFCEVDLPSATEAFFKRIEDGKTHECSLPEDLIRFEVHLKEPVRAHNIGKRRQDLAKTLIKAPTVEDLEINNWTTAENVGQPATSEIISPSVVPHFSALDVRKSETEKLSMGELVERVSNLNVEPTDGMTSSADCEPLPELSHLYAEGEIMTLADLIIFPCIHYIMLVCKSLNHDIYKDLPLVFRWHERMLEDQRVAKSIQCFHFTPFLDEVQLNFAKTCEIPSENGSAPTLYSLYIRDPKRKKSISKYYTKQEDVEYVIKTILESGIRVEYSDHPCQSVTLDWSSLPNEVHPVCGELPVSRVERKCQQVENLVQVVLRIAKTGDRIVDFCSGGGHLGIVLAYLLPECHVIMIDNKEESLSRAQQRIEALNLKNATLYQSNLDYFNGPFDIGTSLHACGVATDLVLKRCINGGAAFVACPCCYGAIQDTHLLSYPRSVQFGQLELSYKNFLVLGHAADQTHANDPKTKQGKLAMGLIDTDRLLHASEKGYGITLCTLTPLSCTPKNNLLIGLPPTRNDKM